MLDFVTYTQRDESRQTLRNFAVNVSGDLLSMPAGEIGFAAGAEYRNHVGWFHPDPIAERGGNRRHSGRTDRRELRRHGVLRRTQFAVGGRRRPVLGAESRGKAFGLQHLGRRSDLQGQQPVQARRIALGAGIVLDRVSRTGNRRALRRRSAGGLHLPRSVLGCPRTIRFVGGWTHRGAARPYRGQLPQVSACPSTSCRATRNCRRYPRATQPSRPRHRRATRSAWCGAETSTAAGSRG